MSKHVRTPLIALSVLVTAVGLFAGAHTASAHHAFAAEFDATQPIDLKGTVTKAKWVNPHSWLWFDVKEADGSTTNWAVEFGAPNALASRGLDKNTLKVGDDVRVQGYRAKNGGPFGYSVIVTLSDGRVFQTGGAQDAPGAQAAKAAAEQAVAESAAKK